jgi:hypothetical protein
MSRGDNITARAAAVGLSTLVAALDSAREGPSTRCSDVPSAHMSDTASRSLTSSGRSSSGSVSYDLTRVWNSLRDGDGTAGDGGSSKRISGTPPLVTEGDFA